MPNGDENLVFERQLKAKQRCQLPDCGKAVMRIYQTQVDGYPLSFCSNDHARVGIGRWMEKKEKGIRPGMPRKVEETIAEGDNIAEIDEKGGEE